jgi:NADPH:quinone reductase-like Zn-dependent oxidoreductase
VQYVMGLTASDRYLRTIVDILTPQSALAMINDPKTFDIVPFKQKSLSAHWESMFTRSLYGTPDIDGQSRLLNEVADLVDAGILRTTANAPVGPITAENLRRAHAIVESGKSIGKVVLAGFDSSPNGAGAIALAAEV